MFSKILVPIDGSEAAEAALMAAGEIAAKFDAEIKILCVYRHHSPWNLRSRWYVPMSPTNRTRR